ncbi:arginine N-methyltransferase 2 [Xylona heveae TC161]|uniref:Arginine N-methyltransferase 2 n=1 Tax=Xylona heveae (strain CBS 132557 / TC161) TaxID=1328760 RepID=A0A165I8E5_XYLHT|nr:arginine N-methyltransferase 2 [Xylona heveae TC161]KZF24533.1 arginine N-methyltransferase 2 [Xylona heveae TC161]
MAPATANPPMTTEQPDPEMAVQMILLAAAHHDRETLRTLLRHGSANVQDPETGATPLHCAIAACAPENLAAGEEESKTEPKKNEPEPQGEEETELEKAQKTIRLLLQNGAIWNDLDNNNETPGCLALRLGLKDMYEMIVDAGVRAELLLNRLDDYEELGDEDEEEEEEEEEEDVEHQDDETKGENDATESKTPEQETTQAAPAAESSEATVDLNSEAYLQSNLSFTSDRILDEDKNGVMMSWETDIMKRSAELLLPGPGLRVLNVGHGMGIIDELFQSHKPSEHHIIEAHPAVLEKLRKEGWYEKPGVTIHEGKWQDILPKMIEEGVMLDAIYFDTFAEDYKALREFFTEYVIGVLDPQGGVDGSGGRWSFFNGLGADRQVCYDVYTKVVEMDIFEAGFDTEWEDLAVPDLDQAGEWDGVRRRYWALKTYRLPICKFMG